MYIIIRNERSQARMMNCVMWSWSMIRVGSPLCLSTTPICIYNINPTSTNTLVR